MARQIKEGEARTFRLKQELCDKMDKMSEETKLSKTAIVEMALEELFAKRLLTSEERIKMRNDADNEFITNRVNNIKNNK